MASIVYCLYLEEQQSYLVFLGWLEQSSTSPCPCSTETVLLRPRDHKATNLQRDTVLARLGYVNHHLNIYDRNVLNTPLCDEAIVTTWLRNGWILGIFFLVRPDTMLISLMRLSSNRKTVSFS